MRSTAVPGRLDFALRAHAGPLGLTFMLWYWGAFRGVAKNNLTYHFDSFRVKIRSVSL
jgi:hypothetical protein